MNELTQLKLLYAQNSKHSNYQILSEKLSSIIGTEQIEVESRYERERLDYIFKNVEITNKSILDIGGNSGYFTFESIEAGARRAHHYEGNIAHSNFVRIAANVLGCGDKVSITNGYYSFESENIKKYDITFLLNVLHHLGDDYGDSKLSIAAAKEKILEQLISMTAITEILIFQLGFCWKGNRDVGLFENGTKSELIEFVTNAADGAFHIEHIGIPVKHGNKLFYDELDDFNVIRDDSLGEFLNRPLFIMRSLL